MGDCVVVLDSEDIIDFSDVDDVKKLIFFIFNYVVLYFLWILVYDFVSNNNIYVFFSGYIVGVFVWVDG